MVKGGLSVDVGVRAFMPASRSGARDAADMEKLVGQEIRCRIIKLDVADEDVVVDRRAVLEDEERAAKERRYIRNQGRRDRARHGAQPDRLRRLRRYRRRGRAAARGRYFLGPRRQAGRRAEAVGQEVEAKVLKVDAAKRRISLGLKQLLPHPWDLVGEKYKVGDRVHGTVTRRGRFRRLRRAGEGRGRA